MGNKVCALALRHGGPQTPPRAYGTTGTARTRPELRASGKPGSTRVAASTWVPNVGPGDRFHSMSGRGWVAGGARVGRNRELGAQTVGNHRSRRVRRGPSRLPQLRAAWRAHRGNGTPRNSAMRVVRQTLPFIRARAAKRTPALRREGHCCRTPAECASPVWGCADCRPDASRERSGAESRENAVAELGLLAHWQGTVSEDALTQLAALPGSATAMGEHQVVENE